MANDERSMPDILHAAKGGDTSPELLMFDLPNFMEFGRGGTPPRQSVPGKVSQDLHCISFSKVLVLWRPWENCPRCVAAIASHKVEIPDDGDYTCPHTQDSEYKRIKDMCLRGDAVLQKEEFFNVRSNDSRCVHILWWTLDEESLARLKAKKDGSAVYPPNPEAVFAKGREDDEKAKAAKKTRGVSKDHPTQ